MISEKSESIKSEQTFNISHYLQYIGSFIIYLGVTRLIFFYGSFNISIVNFLDFSEIITSFLDMIVFSSLLILMTLFQIISFSSKNIFDDKKEIKFKLHNEKRPFKWFILNCMLYRELLFVGFTILLLPIILYINTKDTYYYDWIISIMVLTIILFGASISLDQVHRENSSSAINRMRSKLLLYIIIFTGVVVHSASIEASRIKESKITYGVSLTFDNDDTFVSDSSSYFIGKTLNYIFIHNEITNTTEAIPMSRVKSINF